MRSAWGLEIERDVNWRSAAACGPETAEWFWIIQGCGPTKLSQQNRDALALCESCPVRRQCHSDEMAHRVRDPHIAAGLLWNIDGPKVIQASVNGRKAGAVPAGTPSRPTNIKEQG